MLDIKDKIINLVVNDDQGDPFKFYDLKEKRFIVYFYPKDDTPGCTKEALSFRDNKDVINQLGYSIMGVSKDTPEKHKKFIKKYDLNFTLISDEKLDLCKLFNVWVEKSMYGKKYMGIERSTFVVHENFKVVKIWSKVKVNGHVDDVINFIGN